MGAEIDAWRRDESDIPPRAEEARRLIELGLAAADLLEYRGYRLVPHCSPKGQEWVVLIGGSPTLIGAGRGKTPKDAISDARRTLDEALGPLPA